MTRPSTRRPSVPIHVALLPALALVALALAVAACGSVADSPTTGVAASPAAATGSMASEAPGTPPPPSSSASIDPAAGTPTADPAAAARDALLGRPWATATLTDVATGDSFRIADLAGRTVFVETMAIWCTNCRRQQGEFQSALDRLDPGAVAYVVLTVDPGETAEQLASYRERQGFEGRYAVAGREVAASLAEEFGSTVLNPPGVPLIVVTPSGDVQFRTGSKSPDEIVALAGG